MSVRHVEAALKTDAGSIELVRFDWADTWVSERQNDVHTISKLIAPARVTEHLRFGDCDLVRGHSIAFIPAEVRVGMKASRGRARFGLLQFDRERFEGITGCGTAWDDVDFRLCGDVRSPVLDKVIQRLIAEAVQPGLASDALVDGLTVVAMVEFARYLDAARQRRTRYLGGLAPWQMRRIADYVENRDDAPVSVRDLSELCGISDGHLQRAFKMTAGQTLHAYVEEVRLGRAKALLAKADMPLSAIASKLGFANASGFTIAFRRAAGEPPSAYRRRITRH